MQNKGVQAETVREPGDDQVDLLQYAALLWRRRWLIGGAAIATAAIALVLGLLSPKIYQAQATLLTPPVREGVETRATRVAALESAVKAPEVARKVLEDVGGAAASMALSRFLRGVSVDPGQEANTFVVAVRMPGADLAARTADRLAQLAVERLQRLSEEETARTRPVLEAQAAEARRALERAAADLRGAARRAGIVGSNWRFERGAGSPVDPLFTDDAALTQLETDYRVARDVYERFAARLQEASVQQRAQAQQYRVLVRAVASMAPVAPRVNRNTAVALCLGFVGAVLVALALDAVRRLVRSATRA